MRTLLIILLSYPVFFSNDYLLQAIYSDHKEPETVSEPSYSESPNNPEGEHYSWELGTRDDLPETVIIYTDESSPCGLYE